MIHHCTSAVGQTPDHVDSTGAPPPLNVGAVINVLDDFIFANGDTNNLLTVNSGRKHKIVLTSITGAWHYCWATLSYVLFHCYCVTHTQLSDKTFLLSDESASCNDWLSFVIIRDFIR